MTEKETIEHLEMWYKQGSTARDNGTVNPHMVGTLAGYMHHHGWLKRDLQLALCKANPSYAQSQLASGSVTAALIGV